MRTTLVVVITLCALAGLAPPAEAVTLDQVIALSNAGVSEPVILALIDRDKTIFSIEPDQVIALKNQGLSDAIILAMLRSGRAEGDEAAAADSAARAAAILSASPAPDVTIVGHGPDTPNITHDGYAFSPGYDYPAPLPFAPSIIPIPFLLPPTGHAHRADAHRDRMMCLAQTTGRGGPGGPTLSWVTECPAVMQRSLHRSIQ